MKKKTPEGLTANGGFVALTSSRQGPESLILPIGSKTTYVNEPGRQMTMETRAAVAHNVGQPLSIETVNLEGPKAGEMLVETKATGIGHTDEFTLSGADPD